MPAQHTATEAVELLSFLVEHWPDTKRTRIKQWLKFGSVRVNGEPVARGDHLLEPGDKVDVVLERARRVSFEPLPAGLNIVHEDEAIIVLNKGEGWLTVALDSGRGRTAYAALMDHVRASEPRSRVWIVHRLDRETSGLIVFAKTESGKRALQKEWGRAEKIYLAVVEGAVKSEGGTLRCHLDESKPFRVRRVPPGDDTREAVTHFRVLDRAADRSMLELKIETGRRHQIRVQLSGMGHPVVGDERYGARTNPAGRLGLHAARLSFLHPASGESMTFEAPLPPVLGKLI